MIEFTSLKGLLMSSKKSLTVTLSHDLVEILETLGERDQLSLTEEIRYAISDRKFLCDKVDQGHTVILEKLDEETGETERIIVDIK